ncbi:atypical kinase COQ8B, mitochondrial [Photinus pyralis]|uniref:atypical kinase COQ8B, mitochondrial n=1 Tax=Photinus pyralis TaxID=7054 RepID=UPI0012673AF1|nr:atypical kinase COQ8B, mitochondrial [Photinus pyralis]XP_031340787.1 atypical kinase COQ8B, mitochondrial [Photinus pyralis]
MSRGQELWGVIRGLQAVTEAGIKLQLQLLEKCWHNSSLRTVAQNVYENTKRPTSSSTGKPEDVLKIVTDAADRLYTVVDGVSEFVSFKKFTVHDTAPIRSEVDKSQAKIEHEIILTATDKELLKQLDMEHMEKLKAAAVTQGQLEHKELAQKIQSENVLNAKKQSAKVTFVPNPKSKQKLNLSSKERTVPSSRVARMVSFGSLAAGLGVGTAAEYMRRSIGIGSESESNIFLNKANMDRIVDTLCKVRGAALKLGQMLSIQDESILNPELAKALERVRQSADFMPSWQVDNVLNTEIGPGWRDTLLEFDNKPFAAASIGQVHMGKTLDKENVAIKIQYPGVAKGIESDIDNLVGIMKLWNLFPKGMFINNFVVVAKRELAWEVDYRREAECTRKFKTILEPYPNFHVPKVIDKLCASQVFTTEYVDGIPVDQCVELDMEHRKFIANNMLHLTLLELMVFRYMQTDPNWANFLYNPDTKKIYLLDFGASRDYPKEFVDNYVRIMKAATENDKETVMKVSQDMKFLTGYESKSMEDAHVEAVMLLGEAFRKEGEFSFNGHDTIARMQNLVPTMLSQRLCPPPDEIYSLHRKLSGIYLLCAKLKAPIAARSLFLDLYKNYKFGDN